MLMVVSEQTHSPRSVGEAAIYNARIWPRRLLLINPNYGDIRPHVCLSDAGNPPSLDRTDVAQAKAGQAREIFLSQSALVANSSRILPRRAPNPR